MVIDRALLLLAACKPGAGAAALCNVVQHPRVSAIGNDHIGPFGCDHLGSPELGGHAAGAQGRTGAIGQCQDLPG